MNRLITESGEPSQYGWLKDRFGVARQVVPVELTRLKSDPDPPVAARVKSGHAGAMGKIMVADIEVAANG